MKDHKTSTWSCQPCERARHGTAGDAAGRNGRRFEHGRSGNKPRQRARVCHASADAAAVARLRNGAAVWRTKRKRTHAAPTTVCYSPLCNHAAIFYLQHARLLRARAGGTLRDGSIMLRPLRLAALPHLLRAACADAAHCGRENSDMAARGEERGRMNAGSDGDRLLHCLRCLRGLYYTLPPPTIAVHATCLRTFTAA